jgi:hypothetical protein
MVSVQDEGPETFEEQEDPRHRLTTLNCQQRSPTSLGRGPHGSHSF